MNNEQWLLRVYGDTDFFGTSSFKLMDHIRGVKFVRDEKLADKVRVAVRKLCGASSVLPVFPGKLPVSLEAKNIPDFRRSHYKVSFKSHSKRFLMYIAEPGETFFVDEDENVFMTTLFTFPRRDDPEKQICSMVLDGDMVVDFHEGRRTPRFLVRDVALESLVRSKNFVDRRKWLNEAIINVRIAAAKRGDIRLADESIKIALKDFFEIDWAEKLLGTKFRGCVPHRIDGLQFHSVRLSSNSSERLLEWDERTSGTPGSLSAQSLFKAIRQRNVSEGATLTSPSAGQTRPTILAATQESSGRRIGCKTRRPDENPMLLPLSKNPRKTA